MQVKAKHGENGAEIEVDYDFGANLEEMSELFGEDVVYEKARSAMVVNLQSLIRERAKAGDNPKEIQAKCAEWRPGLKKRGLTAEEKVKREFDKLPDDVKALLLKDIASSASAE